MAEKKKITRKVISKAASSIAPKKEEVAEQVEEVEKGKRTKRGCYFCLNKASPTYTDLVTLRRFLTDRAKILPKAKSNVCSKHQRIVAKNIKYARHLSLLPFVPRV